MVRAAFAVPLLAVLTVVAQAAPLAQVTKSAESTPTTRATQSAQSALLTPAAGILRDVSDTPGAPLFLAGALELAALAVLLLFRLSQRRFRTMS